MDILELKNKNIYLCPKNDITEFYNKYLISEKIFIKGYIDNYKSSEDIIDKNMVSIEDVILVYSPNHWREIIKTLPKKNLFILYNKNNHLELSHNLDFQDYDSSFKIDVNTNFTQKILWANHLKEHLIVNKDFEEYGFEWGNPENSNDPLGNYLAINNLLKRNIDQNSIVLELGTLGGKWTKYLLHSKKVFCVDINSYFIDIIKQRYKSFLNKINFYISKGNELEKIKNNSIDFIFCIDTLVRVEKEFIFDYIKEFSRVLTKDGKAIIHLPNSDIEDCINRNFTKLSTTEIIDEVEKYFNNYTLDSKTIVHGTLLKINIDE